jgi:hypothetical protein
VQRRWAENENGGRGATLRLDRRAHAAGNTPAGRHSRPAKDRRQGEAALLRPYPSDALHAYPVEWTVNNPRNDCAECLAPMR